MNSADAGTAVHVVLGGSAGIGFAYAKWHAARGAALCLVARDTYRLADAKAALLEAGATRVDTVPADLTHAAARTNVLERMRRFACASLFVGGPSPPLGTVEELTTEDLRLACEVCILYPHDVLCAATTASPPPARIVLLSSRVAQEALNDQEFYASALLRRTLDQLVQSLRPRLRSSGILVQVWHVPVVLTPLSLAFARTLHPACPHDTPERRLAAHFTQQRVPTADEYVAKMLLAPAAPDAPPQALP